MRLNPPLGKGIAVLIIAICAMAGFQSQSAPQNQPAINPVILFSLDGFRFDYLEKYHAPQLKALARHGVQAERMIPCYPSMTFPNHMCIATGMYPARHGLIHNQFYDRELDATYTMGKARGQPKWLLGTPLWTYAEQHNVRSATYFWPESDARINGVLPSYYYSYDKSTPNQTRIDQIIDWLKLPVDKRPFFITGYFSLVDSAGHGFGPDSEQVSEAVSQVDDYIGQLKARIDKELDFPVNLVVVSDHGMVEVNSASSIDWAALHDFRQFKVVSSSTQLMLYAKGNIDKNTISTIAARLDLISAGRYQTYTKTQWPKKLHYTDSDRIADIILEASPPAVFSDKKFLHGATGGAHGFNPYTVPEMGAIFIANGPNFKQGVVIPAFENIHVFPAVLSILNLPVPTDIDGRLSVLAPVIQ